jgi:hypothetical protein
MQLMELQNGIFFCQAARGVFFYYFLHIFFYNTTLQNLYMLIYTKYRFNLFYIYIFLVKMQIVLFIIIIIVFA